ncbi:hypothetical protein D048_2462 [Vibrio parahaemolyticus VPTS-2009]|nr:hypothetical protein D048_2462 [Vibrio parahaemolyticus VPTS-2009]
MYLRIFPSILARIATKRERLIKLRPINELFKTTGCYTCSQ